jgi:hypothetical protein
VTPRLGLVPVLDVSGDDPRKGRFEDPRKDSRALNPNILGPIFTPKVIFGRFFGCRFWVDFRLRFRVVFDRRFWVLLSQVAV